ncbi:Os03g0143000 [Oryza sativa Japonica Group]|uniref:Os03g0143000 protein n=1 Tax=Oryza sativa subsp. japonica TaxID=39947 RepID=A0A0P0VT00_ORYSJ|nr:hypothetical protein EE612_015239 [Oryza sativa]BAS82238.1 Os03g0143000 [Oryza sativa Japonica Group]
MAREEEGNRKPSPWSLQTKRSAMAAGEQQPQQQQISASSTSSGRLVTPFWKEKYERDARRYWDIFYKRHEDRVAILVSSRPPLACDLFSSCESTVGCGRL